jgi:hypothetical protein
MFFASDTVEAQHFPLGFCKMALVLIFTVHVPRKHDLVISPQFLFDLLHVCHSYLWRVYFFLDQSHFSWVSYGQVETVCFEINFLYKTWPGGDQDPKPNALALEFTSNQ